MIDFLSQLLGPFHLGGEEEKRRAAGPFAGLKQKLSDSLFSDLYGEMFNPQQPAVPPANTGGGGGYSGPTASFPSPFGFGPRGSGGGAANPLPPVTPPQPVLPENFWTDIDTRIQGAFTAREKAAADKAAADAAAAAAKKKP